MARIMRAPIVGYVALAFAVGAFSPFVPGLLGFALLTLLCGLLFKACFNLQHTAHALWNGKLLSETDYIPIDRKYALAWPVALGCVAIVLAELPMTVAGVILDLTIAIEIIFIAGHLVARSRLLRRFKKIRIERHSQYQ